MFRFFNVPVTTNPTSLWELLVDNLYIDFLGNNLVAGQKNGQIVPDRVAELDVRPGDANIGDVVYNNSTASGATAVVLQNMSKRSNRNSICLKDYLFSSSNADNPADRLTIEIESI